MDSVNFNAYRPYAARIGPARPVPAPAPTDRFGPRHGSGGVTRSGRRRAQIETIPSKRRRSGGATSFAAPGAAGRRLSRSRRVGRGGFPGPVPAPPGRAARAGVRAQAPGAEEDRVQDSPEPVRDRVRLHHPRPVGSAGDVRPGGGDEPRAARAGGGTEGEGSATIRRRVMPGGRCDGPCASHPHSGQRVARSRARSLRVAGRPRRVHRAGRIRCGGDGSREVDEALAAGRVSALLPGGGGFRQHGVARGIHPDLPGARHPAARHHDPRSRDAAVLDHAGALARSDLERVQAGTGHVPHGQDRAELSGSADRNLHGSPVVLHVHRDVVEFHPQHVGDDLGEDGAMPLALRHRGDVRRDRSDRIDGDRRACRRAVLRPRPRGILIR